MELFVQEERGQCRRDHGAQRRKDGAVEGPFHRYAPRLEEEVGARGKHTLHICPAYISMQCNANSMQIPRRCADGGRAGAAVQGATYSVQDAGELPERLQLPDLQVVVGLQEQRHGGALQGGQEAHPGRQRQRVEVRLADGHLKRRHR